MRSRHPATARSSRFRSHAERSRVGAWLIPTSRVCCARGPASTSPRSTPRPHPGSTATRQQGPTPEEEAHDFLWRIRKRLPAPGLIGVFDRSHYEAVLIHKVRGLSTAEEVESRYPVILDFEKELVAAGTKVIKVMLHISRDEQKARLAERLERPDKHWKYNPGDVDERQYWDGYMDAYRVAIEHTSTDDAPWYVVPADRKWYARLAVHTLLLDALRSFQLEWPKAEFDVEVEKKRLAAT
jgi:PPK2 family polyphosphate:nucleotide phosphotransferase